MWTFTAHLLVPVYCLLIGVGIVPVKKTLLTSIESSVFKDMIFILL